MTHEKRTFRYAAVIALGAIGYYLLAGFIIAQISNFAIPQGWLARWPSRAAGLLAWLQVMNVAACLIAALPWALTIAWLIPAYRVRVAFAVSTLTATMVVARLFDSEMSPTRNPGAAYWANFGVLSLAFLLAVPLLVRVMSSDSRARRSRPRNAP